MTPGSLTGGRKVAVTGEMLPDGTVGEIGGVAQKAVAAKDAGATLMLVPRSEARDARSDGRFDEGRKVCAPSTMLSPRSVAPEAMRSTYRCPRPRRRISPESEPRTAHHQYDGAVATDRAREDRPDASGSSDPAGPMFAGRARARLGSHPRRSRAAASRARSEASRRPRSGTSSDGSPTSSRRPVTTSAASRSGSPISRSRSAHPPPLSERAAARAASARRPPGSCARPRKPPPTSAPEPSEHSEAAIEEAQETSRRLREEADVYAKERTSNAESAAAEREQQSIEHADAARVAAERAAAETAERATADCRRRDRTRP